MRNIQRKLRSQAGASMILALIFLMFCSFVGSSVLVSATANAQRVKQLANQQDYLTERSNALLLTDELQMEPNQLLQLFVVDAFQSVQDVTVLENGSVVSQGDPTYRRVVTFRVVTTDPDITATQRLMLESTVLRYLCENPNHPSAGGKTPSETTIQLDRFPAGGSTANVVSSMDKFWVATPVAGSTDVGGIIKVSGTATHGQVTLPQYEIYFSSGREENLYDFFLDFGASSQLKVAMNAITSATTPEILVAPPSDNTQVTSTTLTTVISWSEPVIEKGGVSREEAPA